MINGIYFIGLESAEQKEEMLMLRFEWHIFLLLSRFHMNLEFLQKLFLNNYIMVIINHDLNINKPSPKKYILLRYQPQFDTT